MNKLEKQMAAQLIKLEEIARAMAANGNPPTNIVFADSGKINYVLLKDVSDGMCKTLASEKYSFYEKMVDGYDFSAIIGSRD